MKASKSLSALSQHVKQLGVDAILRLHEGAGLVVLDRYTPEQLDRTRKFLDRDPELLKKLQDGDTIAVMSIAFGDPHDAVKELVEAFESDTTIYFEIPHPARYYHRLAMCRARGVYPAVTVAGLHGEPGAMGIVDMYGKESVIVSQKPEPQEKSSLQPEQKEPDPQGETDDKKQNTSPQVFFPLDAKGLDHLEDYMRPARGEQIEAGPPLLVLASCEAAATDSESPESTAEIISQAAGGIAVAAAHVIINARKDSEGHVIFITEGNGDEPLRDTNGNLVPMPVTYLINYREKRGSAPIITKQQRSRIITFIPQGNNTGEDHD